MKKILLTILVLAMAFSLCACASTAPKESAAPAAESTAPAAESTAPETESAAPAAEAQEITAYVKLGEDAGTILADEIVFVSGDDAEAMAKYGLTEEDFFDDYAIVNEKSEFVGYKLAENCVITAAYSTDGMEIEEHDVSAWSDFETYMKGMDSRVESGITAALTLDKNGDVVAVSEIYLP